MATNLRWSYEFQRNIGLFSSFQHLFKLHTLQYTLNLTLNI